MNGGGDAAVLRIVLEDAGGSGAGGGGGAQSSGVTSSGHTTGNPDGWRDIPTRRDDGTLDWAGTRRGARERYYGTGGGETASIRTAPTGSIQQVNAPRVNKAGDDEPNAARSVWRTQLYSMMIGRAVGSPAVGHAINQVGQAANTIQWAGQQGAQVAGRVAGAMGMQGGGASMMAGAGMGAGMAVAVVGISVGAATVLARAMTDRARELQGYSGQISMSVAMADVRQMRADIREARALGPQYSGITDSWSRFRESIQELLIPLRRLAMDALIPIINWLNRLADGITGPIAHIVQYAETTATFWAKVATLDWAGAQKALDDGAKAAREIANRAKAKDNKEEMEWLNQFFMFADQPVQQWNRQPDPVAKARDQRLNIPAFAGLN